MQSVFLFFFLKPECWVRNQVLRNSPVVKTPPSNAGHLSLKPGWGINFLHATGNVKKKKNTCKKISDLGCLGVEGTLRQ